MASQDEVESTLRWVADEQSVHATADYGDNHAAVSDALSVQRHRVRAVGDYKRNLPKDDDPKARDMSVHEAYQALEEVSSKRLHCLEDIQQISSLEPLFGQLTTEFATKASQLVEAEAARAAGKEKDCGEGVAQAAQSCILAVRANWCWISKLVRCADTHLEHVSDYHQFFHTAAEYNEWMPADLKKATDKVATKEVMNADKEEADQLHLDLMEVLTMFLHWHGKVEALFDKSRKIIPVHLRAKKLDYFRPVNSLCDYKTKEVTVREGEELTLLNNADSQSWKVRNLNNTEAQVPAVILVIPGPEPAAVKAAADLRLQLLGIWTCNVKRIGKSLIWFMILCNHDWTDEEVKKLKAMSKAQKDDLRRCLADIEETLAPYWSDYGGYKELKTRFDKLRSILDQDGPQGDYDAEFSNGLVLKFNTVEELLKRYKDLWNHWDTFRMICETCRAPEFLLIVERWQQLKYMGMDELRSKWHTGFGFTGEDEDEFASWLERWLRTITTTTTVTEEVARSTAAPALETTITTSSKTMPMGQEQFTTSDPSGGVRELMVKEYATIERSSAPGGTGEEVIDGSGYSTTKIVTETTRSKTEGGGQPEMTVTKTEQVYDGSGFGDTATVKGGDPRARELTMTTTDMLGAAPFESGSSSTTTTVMTSGDQIPADDMWSSSSGGSTVTKTTTTRVMSSGGDMTHQQLPPGEDTFMSTNAGTVSQSVTQTSSSATTPGDLLFQGGAGEGSLGSGGYTTTTTTTKTTRGTTGGGLESGTGGEGSGGYSEASTTVVEGSGEGSHPGSSGYSETVTKTSRTLLSSSSGGAGTGTTDVTGQGEGSFGSGNSESWSREQRAKEVIEEQTVTETGASMETATSEQVSTSEQEERRTFVITGVIDPATEKEITMQEAVAKGIINSQTGCYVNTLTGESWPIPVAMNAGFIKVEFTTTKKTAEKRRDVGLITIKTQRESRPYTVKAVVDAKTERRLTVDEAISAGVLDQKNGTYYNALDDSTMSLADAIDSNLLLVEYDKSAEVGEPEIVTKTYAIHSVVDQRAKKTVTFSQAIRKGLLDRETGAYYHNITGEYTYVGDAIKRGFIKATIVKDPNSLDIDPENKLVVEQLQNIRKKLLNPMKAIATLRKAAAAAAEAVIPEEDISLADTNPEDLSEEESGASYTHEILNNVGVPETGDGDESEASAIGVGTKDLADSGSKSGENRGEVEDDRSSEGKVPVSEDSEEAILKVLGSSERVVTGTKVQQSAISKDSSDMIDDIKNVPPMSETECLGNVEVAEAGEGGSSGAAAVEVGTKDVGDPTVSKSNNVTGDGEDILKASGSLETDSKVQKSTTDISSAGENGKQSFESIVTDSNIDKSTTDISGVGEDDEGSFISIAANSKVDESTKDISGVGEDGQSSSSVVGGKGSITPTKRSKARGKKGKVHTAKGDKYKGVMKKSKDSSGECQQSKPEGGELTETQGSTQITTKGEDISKSKGDAGVLTQASDEGRLVIGATDITSGGMSESITTGGRGNESKTDTEVTGIFTTTTTTTTTTTIKLRRRGGSGSETATVSASEAPSSGVAGAAAATTTSTTSTITRATLLTGGAEKGMETVAMQIGASQRSAHHTELMTNICRAAVPLQMLMLILLGMACLVPMTEEEFSCALANGFDHTLGVALRYKDGAPPT